MSYILSLPNLDQALTKQLLHEAFARKVSPQVVAEEWLRLGANMASAQSQADSDDDRLSMLSLAESWTQKDADAFAEALARGRPPELTDEERRAFLALGGTWTKEEAEEFEKAIAPFEEIDEDMWK